MFTKHAPFAEAVKQMRNSIHFSCSRAVLTFYLATIKVSRHKASKSSFDLEMVSFSQMSKCLVPGCNWTAQRHFCPVPVLACCCFSNSWCSETIHCFQCCGFLDCQAALTLSFSLCWKPFFRVCSICGITPDKESLTH